MCIIVVPVFSSFQTMSGGGIPPENAGGGLPGWTGLTGGPSNNMTSTTATSGDHGPGHSFLSAVVEVRNMEHSLLDLLNSFHSGDLSAFGKFNVFILMEIALGINFPRI